MRSLLLMLALVFAAAPARADPAFDPSASERKTIADCLDQNGADELKAMSACIGLIADPCPDAPGANTMTIVACQEREEKIWDGYLNDWYGEAVKRLKDNAHALAALKEAQRAWIRFSAMPNAIIGRSATKAEPSPQWPQAIACALPRDSARSRCATSSTTSIILIAKKDADRGGHPIRVFGHAK